MATRECKFHSANGEKCTRQAMKGWTMCARHASAGGSVAQDRRNKAERKRLAPKSNE